jgi:hypothetical protein
MVLYQPPSSIYRVIHVLDDSRHESLFNALSKDSGLHSCVCPIKAELSPNVKSILDLKVSDIVYSIAVSTTPIMRRTTLTSRHHSSLPYLDQFSGYGISARNVLWTPFATGGCGTTVQLTLKILIWFPMYVPRRCSGTLTAADATGQEVTIEKALRTRNVGTLQCVCSSLILLTDSGHLIHKSNRHISVLTLCHWKCAAAD